MIRFLSPDPGPVGTFVTVPVRRGGKPATSRGRIIDGPNRQGLYHVEVLEECDNYLTGDPVPYYRREIETTT